MESHPPPAPSDRRAQRRELVVLAVAYLVITALSAAYQAGVSREQGKGWDGAVYYGVADQFVHGGLPSGPGPFVYRMGTPYLASLLFPNDLLLSFKVVNEVAAALASLLLVVWLRRFIADWRVRAAICLCFMAQFHGPLRYSFWYPAYVDPWAHVAFVAGLLGIDTMLSAPPHDRRRVAGLMLACATAFLGVMVREVVLVLPLALVCAVNPFTALFSSSLPVEDGSGAPSPRLVSRWQLIAPLLCAFAGVAVVRYLVVNSAVYSFLGTAIEWAYRRTLPEYLRAWFIAFGPALALVLYNWRRTVLFLLSHRVLLAFLVGVSCLGWVGGTDTERFLYWSMPVTYLLIAKAYADNQQVMRSPLFLATLAVLQAVSQRVAWIIPDYLGETPTTTLFLTPIGNAVPLFDLFSFHAAPMIARTSLAQYLGVTIGLLAWLNFRAARLRCGSSIDAPVTPAPRIDGAD